MAGYDDGRVACTEQELVIRNYYFPFGTKRIPYQAIKEARQVPLRFMGRSRIWGSSDFVHWFNLDGKRPGKKQAVVIYTDAKIRPVLTPDQPEQLAAELAAHGVNVTTGTEPGAV
ncbi:MAG TPA: hypothetical protein VGH27_03430 [Streptosporangiaceae bacterium]|jgi:hypothetical protein